MFVEYSDIPKIAAFSEGECGGNPAGVVIRVAR